MRLGLISALLISGCATRASHTEFNAAGDPIRESKFSTRADWGWGYGSISGTSAGGLASAFSGQSSGGFGVDGGREAANPGSVNIGGGDIVMSGPIVSSVPGAAAGHTANVGFRSLVQAIGIDRLFKFLTNRDNVENATERIGINREADRAINDSDNARDVRIREITTPQE